MTFFPPSRLGLGTAPLGNLYAEVSEVDAAATVEMAWNAGVRLFDTAPYYGHGLAERRLGAALAPYARDEYVLSTKVGRLLRPGPRDPYSPFVNVPDEVAHFDFTPDGVRRSLDESLERLGTDRVDVALIHDPDAHLEQAITQAAPALTALRDQGVIRAIGFGMNYVAPLFEAVERCDLDLILVAGRYTLLDQSADDSGLLDLCADRGVDVMAGGVFNSGVLAAPDPSATFDYLPVADDRLAHARAIARLCERHGVALPAAALQFVSREPRIAAVLVGARSPVEIAADVDLLSASIPDALWSELSADGLVPDR